MRGAVRSVLVVFGIVATTLVGHAGVGLAAIPRPEPFPIASMLPTQGQKVGVAHPVIVTFAQPVTDRRAAERSIEVTSATGMTGKYEWLSHDAVQWVPDRFWPAHTTISLSVGDRPLHFQTGSTVLGVADIGDHTFTLYIDGVEQAVMPASMGKARFPTPVGNFSVLAKERTVIMDSRTIGIPLSDPEGYRLSVDYAVRITNGGVYVHSAPWSVGSQGYANVSHGCINLSPDNAAWYFDTTSLGDPVTVQY